MHDNHGSVLYPCQLEVCANSLESALAAQEGGAHRVELCQQLEVGGLTPSAGQIRLARQLLHIGVHVLIRPRAGGFHYTDLEFEVIKADVGYCKAVGCDGVVVGILLANGRVDEARMELLVKLASPMQVTFHRAFDMCSDPQAALEAVIRCGCHRLLTSGMQPTALQGAALIEELVIQANGRVDIMPGSGIDETNVVEIASLTGAQDFHTSARVPLTDEAESRVMGGEMGNRGWISSQQKIRHIADLLRTIQ